MPLSTCSLRAVLIVAALSAAACSSGSEAPTTPAAVGQSQPPGPNATTTTIDARFNYGCEPRASFCSELTCTFDGSASGSTAGPIQGWRWYLTRLLREDNERETATRTGVRVTHTYTSVRCRSYTYSVTLEVTDRAGNRATRTEQVNPSKR